MICPKCGIENDDIQKQCQYCGTQLTSKNKNSNEALLGYIAAVVVIIILVICSVSIFSDAPKQDSIDENSRSYTESTNTVTEHTTEATTKKVNLSDSCDKVLASGYSSSDYYELVATQEETYNDVVVKIGVIKNNEWLIPLTTDSPFINEDGSITYYKYEDGSDDYYRTKNLDDLETDRGFTQIESFGFIGNGCFFGYSEDLSRNISADYPLYEIIYNAELDKVCKAQAYYTGGFLYYANAFCVKTSYKKYINSNKIVFRNYSEDYYNNDFDVNILNTDTMTVDTIIDRTITKEWVGGVFIIGPLSDGLFAIGNSYDITAFYDEEGNNAIDMSEYDVEIYNYVDDSGEYPYFKNGQFKFVTTNEAGTKYDMIIDKTGKVLSSTKHTESDE